MSRHAFALLAVLLSMTAASVARPLPDEASGPEPVDVGQVETPQLQLLSEAGYFDAQGRYVIDVLENDMAFVTLAVATDDGQPVRGAQARFATEGNVHVVRLSGDALSDDSGWISFGITGDRMGAARVTARVGAHAVEAIVNVVSLESLGYAGLDDVEGALRWNALTAARLRFDGDTARVDFPTDVAARDGKRVRLIGFMMPLEADLRQRHFLMTANPPSCFFHIPGGPAGAVEVFAAEGIEASWDPILLEGRFETVADTDLGVVYRLHEARVVQP